MCIVLFNILYRKKVGFNLVLYLVMVRYYLNGRVRFELRVVSFLNLMFLIFCI